MKCVKKQETCSKQKKFARNLKLCLKVSKQLMDSPTSCTKIEAKEIFPGNEMEMGNVKD